MPARTEEEIADAALAMLPETYRTELDVLVRGYAATAALVEGFGFDAQALTVPSTSEGIWLRGIASALGVSASVTDSDDSIRAKIKARPLRCTVTAIKSGVDAVLAAAGAAECTVIEGAWAFLYIADPADTEDYYTDCYTDDDNWLADHRWVLVLCPEGLTDDVELSIANVIDFCRVCGVTAWAEFADGLTPVYMNLQPWPV